MSEFVKALLECREVSKIPEQYDWFAPLLGDWEFDYYDVKNGKRERHVEGEYGAAIRMFLPETKGYDMVYTTRGSMTRLRIQREEGGIVCVWWKSLMDQTC